MIQKFYDRDPMRTNPDNQNATLRAVNLNEDLWTKEGKYKSSLSQLIVFEADSFFSDSYELVVIEGKGLTARETKLVENKDFFLGDEDVELGSPYASALGVKLQDTENVRKAREGRLILRAWVGRQTLKARDLNEILKKLIHSSPSSSSAMGVQPVSLSQIDRLSAWENFTLVGYDSVSQRKKRVSVDELRKRMHGAEFSTEEIQGWLISGFSWLEIGVFLLQHKNLKNQEGVDPFTCMNIPSEYIDDVITFIKTEEGFSLTGVALCDGEVFVDGSGIAWNLKDRFIRAYAPNLQHDGNTMIPYQVQEDAMRRIQGVIGNGFGKAPVKDVQADGSEDTGVFAGTVVGTIQSGGGGGAQFKAGAIVFDNAKVTPTSSENRPKAIYIPFFQVVKKLKWTTLNYYQPSSLSLN